MTSQEAYQFIFEFDPETGDAGALAAALGITGPRPAFNLPHFIEVGSSSVRDTVFDALRGGDIWSIPMLVAMQEYGMPSGSFTTPRLWHSEFAFEIESTLRESAQAAYGPESEMMIDLNRRFVDFEIDLCRRENCEWATTWYVPPGTVTRPLGMTENRLFTGTVTVASDTGAGDEAPIMVQKLHDWVPIEGYLAELPAFGIDQSNGLFDGMVVVDPEVTVFGWAMPGTTIRIGQESIRVTDTWWELTVDVPADGVIEVIGESPDGPSRAETLLVNYMPSLEATFGYIVGIEKTTDGRDALEVDYAQWLFGEEATLAAREDGVIGPDDFIENDYYIRNENPRLRIIPIDDYAFVLLFSATAGPIEAVSVPLHDFLRIIGTGDDTAWFGAASQGTPFWFIVDGDDLIYQVSQQYIP